MAGSILPLELAEMIIDELSEHSSALLTCSLVSKCWRPRALSHLFRSIRICEDDAAVSVCGPTRICTAAQFVQLQQSMPDLLLPLRHLEFYSPHRRQNRCNLATRALLAFFAELSLQAPLRVEKLSCFGQAPWNPYLGGLSERLPCVQRLWIEQLATVTVPVGALWNVVDLDVGLDAMARFPRSADPKDDPEPTALRRLTIRMRGFSALWYIGYYMSNIIQKRSPLLERINIIEELESNRLDGSFVSDFLEKTTETRHLIQSIELKLVSWVDIENDRLHEMLRHCNRLSTLRFVVALPRIHDDPLPPLTDLPYLTHLEIAFTEIEDASGLNMLPELCNWAALEAALLSNARFARLSVTLQVLGLDPARAELALEELAGFVPSLQGRGMLYTEVREVTREVPDLVD